MLINDLEDNMYSKVLKSADDFKICVDVSSAEDKRKLQNDLKCAKDWLRSGIRSSLCPSTRPCMQGHNDRQNIYDTAGRKRLEVDEEKDLGTVINRSRQ